MSSMDNKSRIQKFTEIYHLNSQNLIPRQFFVSLYNTKKLTFKVFLLPSYMENRRLLPHWKDNSMVPGLYAKMFTQVKTTCACHKPVIDVYDISAYFHVKNIDNKKHKENKRINFNTGNRIWNIEQLSPMKGRKNNICN